MLQLAGKNLNSRLLLGTAGYSSPKVLKDSVEASGAEIITVSLRRANFEDQFKNSFWQTLKKWPQYILPNTAGCRSAREAILIAQMSRELFDTNWIKLEVIGDEHTLQPDPFELVVAAKELIEQGFEVFPYTTEDLILNQKLVNVGCKIIMPWASPIGSGRGIMNPYLLKTLRKRLPHIKLIIDAGIGRPSHAALAMEMGFDAVLLNTAVSNAADPVKMASAFKKSVEAGRMAFRSGMMPKKDFAQPSSPVSGIPIWHQHSRETGASR